MKQVREAQLGIRAQSLVFTPPLRSRHLFHRGVFRSSDLRQILTQPVFPTWLSGSAPSGTEPRFGSPCSGSSRAASQRNPGLNGGKYVKSLLLWKVGVCVLPVLIAGMP